MEQLGSHWTDFHEIWYLSIFRKSVKKIRVSLILDKNNGYFTWRPIYDFYHLAHFFLEWEMFQTKSCRENQKTHFVFSNFFFSFENRAVYEIMWKNNVGPDRPQMTIWRMRIACWILKATNTHSQYVILISFPLQQWLHERATMLRHTYIACIVISNLSKTQPFSKVRCRILTRSNCLSN
jgi:hypothetical protein